MNAALVKVDVAAWLTGQSVTTLFDRADGASLTEPALMWVFDFSNGEALRRDLRFWVIELECPMERTQQAIHGFTLDQVIARILPEKRMNFAAGEVDALFQIRHNTRRELFDSAGTTAGRNFYSRTELATFLHERWLGHCSGVSMSAARKPEAAS